MPEGAVSLILGVTIAALFFFAISTARGCSLAPRDKVVTGAWVSPEQLALGDQVCCRLEAGCDFTVAGYVDYSAVGYMWRRFRLLADEDVRWLQVRDDGGLLEMTWWRDVVLETALAEAPARSVEHAGRRYRLRETSAVAARATGNVGACRSDSCHYWEYAAGGSHRLVVEHWGTEREVRVGERIYRRELGIFPVSTSRTAGRPASKRRRRKR